MTEEDETVLFGDSSEQSAESDNENLEERIEDLEEQVKYLQRDVSNLKPSVRRVETKNGTRFIAEQKFTRWYKPEEFKDKITGGDQ